MKNIETALTLLNNKRSQLQPVFNPEDSTELAIIKAERGELLIEALRGELIGLANATYSLNSSRVFEKQKNALLALSFVGELLVKEFPYKVPRNGKFAFLPRLLGRAKVTFRFKRGNAILGNVTIMADGYTAPITAGNFVDLSIRGFYTGLPIKSVIKRFAADTELYTASVNILGSYNEGK